MKNTHLEHLEDDILNSGTAGGFNVISFLNSFGNMLSGKSSDLNITTKWDGAPAIVCGIDPITKKFFVGTKSVFNKVNPKVCYDDTDVDRFYNGQLADKLKDCLQYLPQLKIDGIIQGDLLFTENDKKSGIIAGNRVICFTPNTITYAVPYSSIEGFKVNKAKVGVVFHTVYQGQTLQDCEVVPQKKISVFDDIDDIFVASANFNDINNSSLFTGSEYNRYNSLVNQANGSLKQCSKFLDQVLKQGQSKFVMNLLLKRFFNQRIRGGRPIKNTKDLVTQFAHFYRLEFDAEKSTKKTEKTRDKYEQHKIDGLMFIAKYQKELYHLFASYISIRSAKKMVINQLNKTGAIKTYIGKVPTNPEGYVVCKDNQMLKFVDDEFRKANITVDKTWDSK